MVMNFGNINLHNTKLELSAGYPSQLLFNSLPQLALSGRSNVGKSSLINSMLGRKSLARVSSEPGKTITANFFNIDNKLYFVDLPGYGFAKRSQADKQKWSSLTEAYFAQENTKRIVLQLVDCKIGPTQDDINMIDWMNHYNIPYIIVATKIDRLNTTELKRAVKNLSRFEDFREGTEIYLYSAKKNQGREELWDAVLTKLIDEQAHTE